MSAGAVFVTGGARGIGRAIVHECLRLGHDVAFSYRDTPTEHDEASGALEAASKAFPSRRCSAYVLDVRDSAAADLLAEKVIATFRCVYGVVCNAGINAVRLTSQLSDSEWDDIVRTNLTGAFYTCRAFLDHLLLNRNGRIVMMSSLNRDGAAGTSAYSASKAGLIGLAGSIAKEYGPRGITCNCVAPGLIDTGMTRGKMTEAMEGFWNERCSLGRLGYAEEVAYAVGFLLSERASLINGVILPATGGLDWFP